MRRAIPPGMIVAVAAVLLGAGNAAAVQNTVLCTESKAPCPAKETILGSTWIEAKATTAVTLKGFNYGGMGGTLVISCQESEVTAKTAEDKGAPHLPIRFFELDFDDCTGPFGKCTVLALNLQYDSWLSHATSNLTAYQFNPEGPPRASITCGVLFTCEFEVDETSALVPGKPVANFSVTGGNEEKALVEALGVSLKTTEACAVESGSMTASWKITKPANIWVSYVE